MHSGRPVYEPNPAAQASGHRYEIDRLKRRLAPPQGSVNPRISFGQVDGGGDPQDAGSGDWTVETDFAGNWTVTFDPPFAAAPTVGLFANETTSLGSPGQEIKLELISRAADSLIIATYREGALDDDIGFDFIAVGLNAGTDVVDVAP